MIIETDRPVDDRTSAAIRAAVEPFRAALGIDGVDVAADADFEGDPVIYVRFKHRLVKPGLALGPIAAMEEQVRAAARETGERRFVHMQHDFHDRQELAPDT